MASEVGAMAESVWRLPKKGVDLAVLADCHIHEGGPQFPPALFPRLQGVDLIVTLGDMGEKAGLDQLQEIAPVIGVRGVDDVEDMRTRRPYLLLKHGRYDIGCVFDAREAGLAADVDPFVAADDWEAVSTRLFGCAVDVLLHAGAHRSDEARLGRKGSAINPGSPVLPAEGAAPSFLRLKVTDDGCYGQIIWVA
jgi:putative phosphoesterase